MTNAFDLDDYRLAVPTAVRSIAIRQWHLLASKSRLSLSPTTTSCICPAPLLMAWVDVALTSSDTKTFLLIEDLVDMNKAFGNIAVSKLDCNSSHGQKRRQPSS